MLNRMLSIFGRKIPSTFLQQLLLAYLSASFRVRDALKRNQRVPRKRKAKLQKWGKKEKEEAGKAVKCEKRGREIREKWGRKKWRCVNKIRFKNQ